ncbi:MAG: SDR family NAD(P)-dependent oxidoreductase, partial [Actinobacteria bacterium]|nr:SDR family NAD(P)-dependent oxidoreductase [Actinomycetota bacterium]
MSNLKDKVAVVTGGSRGIGRAICLRLAKSGSAVVVNFTKDTEKAQNVAEEINKNGGAGSVFQADVSDIQQARDLIEFAVQKFGKIDILVNNAGVTSDSLLIRMKEEEWDKVLSTNLKSVFNCTQPAVKHMIKQRNGAIVNISSVIGIIGNAGQSNYAASKAGIIGFTKSVA